MTREKIVWNWIVDERWRWRWKRNDDVVNNMLKRARWLTETQMNNRVSDIVIYVKRRGGRQWSWSQCNDEKNWTRWKCNFYPTSFVCVFFWLNMLWRWWMVDCTTVDGTYIYLVIINLFILHLNYAAQLNCSKSFATNKAMIQKKNAMDNGTANHLW